VIVTWFLVCLRGWIAAWKKLDGSRLIQFESDVLNDAWGEEVRLLDLTSASENECHIYSCDEVAQTKTREHLQPIKLERCGEIDAGPRGSEMSDHDFLGRLEIHVIFHMLSCK
jgi:hypothetical protein